MFGPVTGSTHGGEWPAEKAVHTVVTRKHKRERKRKVSSTRA